MKRTVAVLAILLAAALRVGPAADSPAPAPAPIRLDAIVTDRKDRPIRDLSASDFEIRDNGDPRPIDSATLESGREGRLIAIFLDDYHVQSGENTTRARAALAQFVDAELRPNDLVAVMKPLDSLNAIQVTRDRGALRSAIDAFEGRKGDYAPRTPFEESFMSRAPSSADASRAQVVSSALQALALRIGGMREGRKTIVLVSEGFTPSLPRGSDRLTGSLRAVVYAANRYGVAIYPIDPREAADTSDAGRATSSLQTLADETGGEATINRTDLTAGMKQAARDLDDYYELTYRAAGAGDGKFHQVEVRVKRPDALIRMRSGYWSASPEMLRPAAGPAPRAVTVPTRAPHATARPHAAPAAALEVSRTALLRLRVPVCGPDEATPTVTATLLNPVGTPMRSLSEVPAQLPAGLVQFDLPLASLAPNEYRVEVVA